MHWLPHSIFHLYILAHLLSASLFFLLSLLSLLSSPLLSLPSPFTPKAMSMGVHESQSLLWERYVALQRPFQVHMKTSRYSSSLFPHPVCVSVSIHSFTPLSLLSLLMPLPGLSTEEVSWVLSRRFSRWRHSGHGLQSYEQSQFWRAYSSRVRWADLHDARDPQVLLSLSPLFSHSLSLSLTHTHTHSWCTWSSGTSSREGLLMVVSTYRMSRR